MKSKVQMPQNGRSMFARALMYSAAAGALGAMAAAPAYAQQKEETVVVTGSNIRGALPTGQSLITVDKSDIEATGAVSVQQLIQTLVPQINGFGTAGQSSQNAFEPKIHSVGGGSSNSTLTLVDGHQIPASGGMYRLADPSVIPPDAVDRIDVLPDGASAVYGANAVAGVINVITRKDFNGWSTTFQAGVADHYNTANFSQTFGRSWDSGNVLVSYAYSDRSNLMGINRSFVGANKSNTGVNAMNLGGTNFANYSCYPATIVPATGQTYAYPYTVGTAIASGSGTANGICDSSSTSSLLPSEVTNRMFGTINEQITPKLRASLDLLYSQRFNTSRMSRGSEATVTVWGTGSAPPGGAGQINPFYVSIPGVTKQTISFNLDGLLGPGAYDKSGSQDVFATLSLDYDIGGDWAADLTATSGEGTGTDRSAGNICIPCANLALNGSVNAAGNQAANAGGDAIGSNEIVTRSLTTANALNIWGAAGVAKAGGVDTQKTVLDTLTDSTANTVSQRTLVDVRLKFDGPLFTLPAGDIKVAIGAEFTHQGSYSLGTGNNGAGATTTNSTSVVTLLGRQLESAFAEIQLPVISEEMNIPLVKKLDFNFSGRLDHYSDLASSGGNTTNPKVGMGWQVYDDLKLRASWGTSFSPPAVGQSLATGGNYFDLRTGLTSAGGGAVQAFTIPSTYPGAATLCPTGCVFASGAVGPLNGIVIRGSNTSLVPQTGMDYSMGATFSPSFLKGFYADITFWGANYNQVITNSQSGPATNIANPGLYYLFTVGPTATQIADAVRGRVANSPIPANIQYIYDERLINLLNYQAQGIDYNISYRFSTMDYGDFTLGANVAQKTKFKQQAFQGAPWTQSLNIGNASNTFSPVDLTGRFNLGWSFEDFNVQTYLNYTTSYSVTTTQTPFNLAPCPVGVTVSGLGCQKISSNITIDMHGSYNLATSLLGSTQLFLDLQNLFDKKPPFFNSTSGYDPNWSNPIGRIVSFGLRQKF